MASNPFYFPAHEVQRPTHDRIHVRSAEDAHTLFESVRLGVLRPVIRRLNDAERSAFIRSGSVFIWEESEEAIGLRRWTDGLMWSASRMREPFLFYESKRGTRSSGASAGPRLSSETLASTSSTDASSPRSSMEQNVPGLVKQTYSAIVVGDGTRRKWHMTAYFTNADYSSLPTIQHDPRLRAIKVPRGMYRSGKSRQSAKSLQAEWGSGPNSGDITTLQDGQPNLVMMTGGGGYDSASPSGSPTMEYPQGSLRHGSPTSPYSRPSSSSYRPQSASYPFPTHPPSRQHSNSSVTYVRESPYPQQPIMHVPLVSSPILAPMQGAAVLPPLQSTYADQRFVLSAPRSSGRTAEDERMLHLFKSIP